MPRLRLPPTRRCRGRAGSKRAAFTLIEVLAALMLIAVVLPVVMNALSAATRAGSLSRSRDVAVTLAEARLAEIVAEGTWQTRSRARPFDASAGPDAERYTWTLEARDWHDPQLTALTIEVRWEQHGRERVQRLTTVVPAEEAAP